MAAPYDPNQQVPYQAVYEPQPAMAAYAPAPAAGLLTTEPDGSSRIQLAIVGPQVGAVLGRNGANISQIRAVQLLICVLAICQCLLCVAAVQSQFMLLLGLPLLLDKNPCQ